MLHWRSKIQCLIINIFGTEHNLIGDAQLPGRSMITLSIFKIILLYKRYRSMRRLALERDAKTSQLDEHSEDSDGDSSESSKTGQHLKTWHDRSTISIEAAEVTTRKVLD